MLQAYHDEPKSRDRLARAVRAMTVACPLIGIAIGLSALLGWLLDIQRLKDWLGSGVTIKANTSLLITLTGLALFLAGPRHRPRWMRLLGRTIAAGAALFAAMVASQHLTGVDLGIDQALFAEAPGSRATASPGRMGLPSTLAMVLLSAAVIAMSARRPRFRLTAAGLGAAACVVAMTPLIGYILGADGLYAVVKWTGIAFQTAFAILVLGLGTIAACPERGLAAIVTAPGPGGVLARRVLPAALGVPPLAAIIAAALIESGKSDAAFALAFVAAMLMATMAGLVLVTATRLERASDRLRAEATRYRTLFMTSAVGVLHVGADGRYIDANTAACNLTGRTREQLLGTSFTAITHPEDLAIETILVEDLLAGRRDKYEMEKRYVRADGSIIWVALASAAVRDAQGRFIYRVNTAVDLTDRRAAMAKERRHAEDLERAVAERTRQLAQTSARLALNERMAAVGTLAAGLGHDIGNLLLPLDAHVEALERANLGPFERESVSALRQCVQYMRSLVRGLRLFTEGAAAGRHAEIRESRETTDPVTWCEQAMTFLQYAVGREVRMECRVMPGARPIAMPPHLLSQALLNLVQNARDALHGQSDGVVRVEIEPAEPNPESPHTPAREGGEGWVRIRVKDNGPGMTPEVRARCLEPYFTTKVRGSQQGTGLGLALVHEAVKRAGGTLTVESEPGRGATFTLTLPAAPIPSDTDARPRARVDVRDRDKWRVSRGLLTAMGFDVDDMADRQEAPGRDVALWVLEGDEHVLPQVRTFIADRGAERVVAVAADPAPFRAAGVAAVGSDAQMSEFMASLRNAASTVDRRPPP